MTRIEYLRQWQVTIRKQLDKLAHASLAATLSFDSYNNARGRYRELRDMLVMIDDESKRIQGGGDDEPIADPEPAPDDEDDFEPPAAQAAPVRRRQATRRAREWGG